MSVPDFSQSESRYSLSPWPQQVISSYGEDQYAIMENLLRQIEPAGGERGKIPLLIEARLWLADILRRQGKYDEAVKLCEVLIEYADSLESQNGGLSDKQIWCLAKAFIDYIDCGRFCSGLPVTQLLKMVEKGMGWLEKIDRPNWAAGLLLERALLLKNQRRFEEALSEGEEALKRRENCEDAPGYSLYTHRIELAELLYATTYENENTERKNLTRAADLVSIVPSASASTLNERMLACLSLAKIRQKLGEENTALVELGKAQKFAHEIEQATAAETSHQLLNRVYHDAREIARATAEVEQKLGSIKERPPDGASRSLDFETASHSDKVPSVVPRHLSCYVSLPHFEEHNDLFYNRVLLPALKQILEHKPYYWQVGYRGENLKYSQGACVTCPVNGNGDKKSCWLRCADLYIVDIEGWSPDVILYASSEKLRSEPLPPAAWHQASEIS